MKQTQLPNMPRFAPEHSKPAKRVLSGPYYLRHPKRREMVSTDPFTGEFCYIPLDLASPRILLFNCRLTAMRYAHPVNADVVPYPGIWPMGEDT